MAAGRRSGAGDPCLSHHCSQAGPGAHRCDLEWAYCDFLAFGAEIVPPSTVGGLAVSSIHGVRA